MMIKSKKFKIIAKMDDLISVEDTDKKERVSEWVKKFINATDGGEVRASIEVYERVEQGMYKCVHSTSYDPKLETERLIGFGRW
jgi:hypothetical protein